MFGLRRWRGRFGWVSLAAVVAASVLVGCSKKEEAPTVLTLEGKVDSIERGPDGTGTITVRYYNEKQKQEMLGAGRVTRETEILIDGAAATLDDVREGDHVRGDVRIEKKKGGRVHTVVRIRVERPRTDGG